MVQKTSNSENIEIIKKSNHFAKRSYIRIGNSNFKHYDARIMEMTSSVVEVEQGQGHKVQ